MLRANKGCPKNRRNAKSAQKRQKAGFGANLIRPQRQIVRINLGERFMTRETNTQLEGITLNVYWYVVKEGKPVGPREVMKGTHLSSPSVAYRHLQKLEELNLLRKNEYGEYIVKRKVNAQGYVWIGRRLFSKMLLYSLIFLAALALEAFVLAWHFEVENYKFKIFFALLMLATGAPMVLFILEDRLQRRRIDRTTQAEQEK